MSPWFTVTNDRVANMHSIGKYIVLSYLIVIGELHLSVGKSAAGEELRTEGVITLLGEVRVPAREAGILAELLIDAGSNVTAGMLLGRLDDTQATLLRDQSAIELQHAERLAGNDLQIRLARKAHEVAAAELKRALEAAERFAKSVSQTEIDRLRLTVDQTSLQIEQSQFDLETARLAVSTKTAALGLAEHELSKRSIRAESPGVVVEVLKQTGEWVEPGEVVARLVRMDRLRVEGFLPAPQATSKLVGRATRILVKLQDNDLVEIAGKVTFVSPEIHPVNNMVRIWAEVSNADGALRPGLQATLKILP